jgi:NADH-quinone oxidoreductase subunit L
VLTIITLCILIGVTGKSAQIPLFVWLPDAMAGPTPVSALIHAATMVTAGIFVVTRSNVFFQAAPLSAAIMTLIGAATGIMAGFIALGQWDIKRVLAYSTVSQLGFMVAAIGRTVMAAGVVTVKVTPKNILMPTRVAHMASTRKSTRARCLIRRICATWAVCGRGCP